jgi:hypothetical protein
MRDDISEAEGALLQAEIQPSPTLTELDVAN